MARSFAERSLESLTGAVRQALDAETFSARPGLMQRVDARIKCVSLLFWIIVAVSVRRWECILFLLVCAAALTLSSRIPFSHLIWREWLPVATFTALIALPGLFLVPGPRTELWGMELSQHGASSALLLLLRTLTSATLALLLALTTPWTELIRGLRSLAVPALLTAILAMTQRYIFLLLELAEDLFTARRARMVGVMTRTEGRRVATATAGVLLDRSLHVATEVGDAMQARGFRGDFPTLHQKSLVSRDWVALLCFLVMGILTLLWGLN